MTSVAPTAFYTSIISYLVFALADYVRPGFVSFTFSVHWFLLAAILSGIWWAYTNDAYRERGHLQRVAGSLGRSLIGLALLVVFWQEGEGFGDLRIFVALVAFFIPWMIHGKE